MNRFASLDELLGVCQRHLERQLARQRPRLEDGRVRGVMIPFFTGIGIRIGITA